MPATTTPISRLLRPLPQAWGALAAFSLPVAVLASFALPSDLGAWTGAMWVLRFQVAGVAAWATLAYLRDYRSVAPRALVLLAAGQVLFLLVVLLVLVGATANVVAERQNHWLAASVSIVLWLAATALSVRSCHRRTRGLGWLLTIGLALGTVHQTVGWMAVHHLRAHPAELNLDDMGSRLRFNLVARPAATLFYYHSVMSGYPALFPWKLVPLPPRSITYFLLAHLESAAVVTALLAGMLVVRRVRAPGRPTGGVALMLRAALFSAVVGVLVGGYHLFAQVQVLRAWGSTVFIELEILLVLLLVPAAYLTPPVALVSLAELLRPRGRRRGLAALLCLVLFWVPCLVSWRVAPSMRLRGLARVSEHAAPVIAAMDAYIEETGFSGRVLEAQASEYFGDVLERRFGAYPGRYFVFGGGGPEKPWTIWMQVPTGTSFRPETLLYRSDHDYTDVKGVRVGDWMLTG